MEAIDSHSNIRTRYNPTTLSALIPQLFYDVIARIVPGIVMLIFFYLIFNLEDPLNNTKLEKMYNWFSIFSKSKIIVALNITFSSYVITFILNGFVSIIYDNFKPIVNRMKNQYVKVKSKAEILFKETFEIENKIEIKTDDYAILYDLIRMEEPGAGARIVKIRAEYHFCRTLVLGFFILAILNPINNGFCKNSLILESIIIFSFASFILSFLTRRKRFLWGLCNHWLFIRNRDVINK